MIKKMFLITVILGSFWACGTTQESDKDFSTKLDSLIGETDFNGTILVCDGENRYIKGFGYADYENKIINTENTKFEVGSVSKQFIAAGIMLLQDDGMLSVDDLVSKYIDFLPEKKITIHQLLNHTSGIRQYANKAFDNHIESNFQENNPVINPLYIMEYIKGLKDYSNPGSSFEYNNSNYLLLAIIIEAVSGLSLEDFFREEIFEPLEMYDTGHVLFFNKLDNAATGYYIAEDVFSSYLDPNYNLSNAFGSGSFYSTAVDMEVWHKALNGDFLSNKSKEMMFTNSQKTSSGVSYGYGWDIVEDNNIVWHDGLICGFNSFFYRDITNNKVIIVLGNTSKPDSFNKIKNILLQSI